jgi:hypothetical protein
VCLHAKSSVRLLVGGPADDACCAHTAPSMSDSNSSANPRAMVFVFPRFTFPGSKAPEGASQSAWLRARPLLADSHRGGSG